MYSLLATVDNPFRDIYLAATLRSPFFGFTLEDLVTIRSAADGSLSLYEALCKAAQDGVSDALLSAKIEDFLTLTGATKATLKLMDIKIFVDADDDDRLMRVMARDIVERGKTVEWVIERYSKTVKPMYLQFIEPSKRYADIIIPQGGHNKVAIDVISATIEKSLQK